MFYKIIKNNCSGFSLPEIMVAFLIITIALLGLAGSFPFGLSANKSAQNLTTASYLAQAKLEEIFSLGYENIEVGIIEEKQRISEDPESYLYFYQKESSVDFVDPENNFSTVAWDTGIKKISSTIYFNDSLFKKEKSYIIAVFISSD